MSSALEATGAPSPALVFDTLFAYQRTAALLDPRSPACVASTARFLGNPMIQEPFNRLAGIVRNGRTVLPGQGSVEPENPAWVESAHSMAQVMAPMAAPLGSIVLEGKKGPVSVLDIAAGHGLFGIEVAKQNPEARVVAVDWAAVLEVACANARRAGVHDRYETRAGSAFEVEYGGPYDIVLLTNFLHHFDPPTCVGLLKKVHASVGWALDPNHTFLDNPASYSNFGKGRIDFAAPGGDFVYPGNEDCTLAEVTVPCWVFDMVFSTIPGGWSWAAGTSMAAPHAAGIAAQYIGAAGGHLPPKAVEGLLGAWADHPNGNRRRDPFYGYGRVDATPLDHHHDWQEQELR